METNVETEQQDQQSTRPLGDQNGLDSLEENPTGEKPMVQQPAQENQSCNTNADKEKRSDPGNESDMMTSQCTEKDQQSDAANKLGGCDWLREAGEKAKKKQGSNEKQGLRGKPRKRKYSTVSTNENQQQEQSTVKESQTRNQSTVKENRSDSGMETNVETEQSGNIGPDSTQEQKPLPKQVTLTFRWSGRKTDTHKFNTIGADPCDTIIDALKKDHDFTKRFKTGSYVIIIAESLNAIVNPSVPCGALSKGEKLVLRQQKLNQTEMNELETPAYQYRPGGLFFKVKSKGETDGGANSVILHNHDLFSTDSLAVYGYREESIKDALTNDRRFKVMKLFKLRTERRTYALSLQLSKLQKDTYTIITCKKRKATQPTTEPARNRNGAGSPAEDPQATQPTTEPAKNRNGAASPAEDPQATQTTTEPAKNRNSAGSPAEAPQATQPTTELAKNRNSAGSPAGAPQATQPTTEPARNRNGAASPAGAPQAALTPYTHSASDRQCQRAPYRPATEIEMIVEESFKKFVSDSGGIDNAWRIISEQCDNDFQKFPFEVGPLKKHMKKTGSVAMIQVRGGNTGDTVIAQGTCFWLSGGLFLTCHHVVEPALNANAQCKVEVIFSYEHPSQTQNDLSPVPAEIILSSKEHDYAFIHVRKMFIPARKQLIHARKQLIHARKQLIPARRQLIPARRQLFPARRQLFRNRKQLIPARRQLFRNQKQLIPARKKLFRDWKQLIHAKAAYTEGLLQYLGLPGEKGRVIIIGHPGGECEQIDFCAVLDIPKCHEKGHQYPAFVSLLTWYGYVKIKFPGVMAYKTSMYEGASGAPVFNEDSQLVSMHTGGYTVHSPLEEEHLIDIGSSVVDIILYGLVKMETENQKLTEMEDLHRRLKKMATKSEPLKEYIENHETYTQPIITQLLQDTTQNNSNDGSPMEISGEKEDLHRSLKEMPAHSTNLGIYGDHHASTQPIVTQLSQNMAQNNSDDGSSMDTS